MQENVSQNQSIFGKTLWLKEKKGRPSLTGETTDNDNEFPRTRSKTEQHDKTICIICQKPDCGTKKLGRLCYQ